MALETKPFRNLPQLPNGTSVADNIKLTDCLPFQHTDINEGVNSFNKITMGQMLCEPVATAGAISGDTYSATCSNFPDFAISYTDEQQNSHYYVGMKVRVVFNNGITYGSVSGGTYPKLNINNSGAIPLLAQGKTMASGACSAGQTLEFTLIPYGNGVAWDADSNVRESTSDYTIYTDGSKKVLSKLVSWEKYISSQNTNYYFHKDINTNTADIPKWIKVTLSAHQGAGSLTCVSEYILRLNYTSISGTVNRGLTPIFVQGGYSDASAASNFSLITNWGNMEFGWDSNGIYFNKKSISQVGGIELICESPFGIEYRL